MIRYHGRQPFSCGINLEEASCIPANTVKSTCGILMKIEISVSIPTAGSCSGFFYKPLENFPQSLEKMQEFLYNKK